MSKRKYDREAAMKRMEEEYRNKESGGGGLSFTNSEVLDDCNIEIYKIKDKNFIRFLPQVDDKFWSKVAMHYVEGIGYFLCCKPHNKGMDDIGWPGIGSGKCSLCDEYVKLRNKKKEESDEYKKSSIARHMGKYKYTTRILYFGRDVTDKDTSEESTKLFILPKQVHDGMVDCSYDEMSGKPIWIADPEDGYTFFFKRTGKGINTEYSGYKTYDDYQKVPDSWLEDIPSFQEVLVLRSPDEIEELIGNNGGGDETEEEEPTTRRGRSRYDEDDEEEVTQNRRSSRSNRSRDVEEDDFDDEQDEEQDEEEEGDEEESRSKKVEDIAKRARERRKR